MKNIEINFEIQDLETYDCVSVKVNTGDKDYLSLHTNEYETPVRICTDDLPKLIHILENQSLTEDIYYFSYHTTKVTIEKAKIFIDYGDYKGISFGKELLPELLLILKNFTYNNPIANYTM